MSTDGAVAWLRRAVLARLEMARKADTGERWEADRRYGAAWDVDLKPSLGPVASPESGWEASLGIENCDDFENPRFLAMFILHAQHVAANDPRQIIADCESDLAILGEHYILTTSDRNEAYEEFSVVSVGGASRDHGCVTCHYYGMGGVKGFGVCRTVKAVASGYRHWEGWAEHWGEPA